MVPLYRLIIDWLDGKLWPIKIYDWEALGTGLKKWEMVYKYGILHPEHMGSYARWPIGWINDTAVLIAEDFRPTAEHWGSHKIIEAADPKFFDKLEALIQDVADRFEAYAAKSD